MSHRVEQIVDQAASILTAHALFSGVSVLQHRVLSLSDQDQELPAVSITLGDDATLEEDGASNFAFIDSLQTLNFRVVAQSDAGDEEEHLIAALQDLRRAVHVALMADQTLALAFVIGTSYGGADAPVIESKAERLAGQIDCRWLVHYRMNVADPS